VSYIFNPKLTVEELLSTICVEFGIACPAGNSSIKVFIDCINAYLLDAHAKGRHTVLIIDEAQNLSADVLEQMRLLTNLETNQRKLLQIILLGQPELATMLDRPELRQLSQRIVARYHLGPLTKAEVEAYVRHRLEVSGARRTLFPTALMGRLYRLSGGVPRLINVLCDRALLGAYVQGKERVDRATLSKAAREVFHLEQRRNLVRPLLAVLILAVVGLLGMTLYQQELRVTKAAATPATAEKPADAALAADSPAGKASARSAAPGAALAETLAWPEDELRSDGKLTAYAALYRAWGVDFQGGDACRQAEGAGLRCRAARGGLDELRRLNRPAVLLMRDERGREFHAALTALSRNSATFALGAEARTVALGVLAAQWSGHYTVFWRMPHEAHENMRAGERGPAVAWLIKQIAQDQGRVAEPGKNPLFDETLVRQVKQFQLAQGLIPDGAVGPQTLMRLAGIADQSAPKLTSVHEGK
jgi:general secretion pathway protein A